MKTEIDINIPIKSLSLTASILLGVEPENPSSKINKSDYKIWYYFICND